MSAAAPAAAPRSTSGLALIPPEEKFWQRYSPHSEAPLSGVTSTVLHLLALGLLGLVLFIQQLTAEKDEAPSLPLEPIRLSGGGGGSPGGGAPGPAGAGNQGELGEPQEEVKGPPPLEYKDISPQQKAGVSEWFLTDDKDANRWIEVGTEAIGKLGGLEKETRDALRKAVKSGGGQGGSGSGGGRDTGKDKGMGGGVGEGSGGKLTIREKRVLRWGMTFNTSSGEDYRAQLAGLGAHVAFRSEGKFILIRDLNNPSSAKAEDITGLDRIFWIDNKPDSVRSLFSVLGHPQPNEFVAFFPPNLEKKLLALELDAAQRRYNTKDEDRIHETKFDVFKAGGTYDVRVREVYLKQR